METLKAEVVVAKESYELGQGLAQFVIAMKQALSDGWQPGRDIPVILSQALTTLVPALDGADKIADEAGADQAAVITAFAIAALDIYQALGKTRAVAQA